MNFVRRRSLVNRIAFLLLMLAALTSGIAQTSLEVSETEAQQHLLKHVDPVYPPIAKAAQIQGEVILQIEIGLDGHVSQVKSLSGPAMLMGAAVDAAKQWQYKPFEQSGTPIRVISKVRVTFSLGTPKDPEDEEIARAYFPLSTKCIQLVSQRADPADEAAACQKASEQVDRFSTTSRFIERRSTYVYYATALIRAKQSKEAVVTADKAVAVVLQGHDDGSGSSAAYSVRGQAKAWSGDLTGADKDMELAENYQRKALDTPAGRELNKEYSQGLKSMLTFHAQVLTALGRQADAQAKVAEANKL